jgi:hypothetical protein
MKLFKLIILFLASNYIVSTTFAQANPGIAVAPSNGGIVSVGATIDLTITIGNSLGGSIAVSKLRPIIQVPPSVKFLPEVQQLPGLPAGWTILSITATQLRLCNSSDVIGGNETRVITLKVEGVTVAPATTFTGQIAFGNGTTCAAGASVAGNNTADDFATSTIEVVSPCGLTVTALAGTIACNTGTTTITASSTGAPGPIEYSNGGAYQLSNVFTGVVAGSYTVTARQVATPSCINSTTLTILEPAALLAPAVTIVQPTCSLATGIVTITSPTTGLTFSLDGNASYIAYPTGILPPLSAGLHTIRSKNSNDCLSPITNFTLNAQPATPSAPIIGTITQPNCTVSTGAVVLSGLPSGDWTINPGTITGNTLTTTLNNLPAGTYNYTVTNDVGCTSTPSATVTINTVLGAPTAPTVTIVQPTCTVATGTIIVTSATAGLTFKLDNGNYGPYPSGGFTNVLSGNHTLIVQNISGCLSPFTNIVINPQPVSPAAPVVNVSQPTCTVSTGTITVISDTTGLEFSLDGQVFANYSASGYTLVLAGTHNLRVRNTSGCTPSITNNIVVNPQPASPSVTATFSAITCFGGSSTITALGSGAVSPYEYRLNNPVAGPFQSSNIFAVFAGSYTITIKDANGCTGISNNLTIAQPTAVAASITGGSIACSGGNTTLTVLATGGSGVLEYSLDNSPNFQSSNIFNNVVAGSHSARVRPVANPTCSTTTSFITVTQPDSLKAKTSALAINQCGGTTEVKVVASGGKLPHAGVGSFTRGPGKWSFTVTDANGCTSTTEQTILAPGCVYVKIFPNPAQNSITVNHPASSSASTIQVFGMNGSLVLSKAIPQNAFITTVDVSSLASGVYVLVYINGNDKKEMKFIKTSRK